MSQSSSCSLPQSRSGCSGLAGVNISLKNTTAYFSQVRLQTRLVEQTCGGLGSLLICTLLLIVGHATLVQVSPKTGVELNFPVSHSRYLMSNTVVIPVMPLGFLIITALSTLIHCSFI